MKPLQAVGMGLVIVALLVRVHGFDLLADPLGWLLVLHGVRRLPATVPGLPTVRLIGVVALVASVALWVPAVVTALEDADESLLWAATLPQEAFVALLCLRLAGAADEGDDRPAATWLRTAATLTVAAALAPVLVYGAGEEGLLVPTVAVATLVLVLVICLCFGYGSRPWAQPEETGAETAPGAAPPGGGTAPGA